MKLRYPDITTLTLADGDLRLTGNLNFDGGYVSYELTDGLTVRLKSEKTGVSFLTLRWNIPMRPDVKVLGDAWERGYGDLQWLPMDSTRGMPCGSATGMGLP